MCVTVLFCFGFKLCFLLCYCQLYSIFRCSANTLTNSFISFYMCFGFVFVFCCCCCYRCFSFCFFCFFAKRIKTVFDVIFFSGCLLHRYLSVLGSFHPVDPWRHLRRCWEGCALLSETRLYQIIKSAGKYVNSKWFEPRSISSSCSVIVRVSVVLKRTVGDSD